MAARVLAGGGDTSNSSSRRLIVLALLNTDFFFICSHECTINQVLNMIMKVKIQLLFIPKYINTHTIILNKIHTQVQLHNLF